MTIHNTEHSYTSDVVGVASNDENNATISYLLTDASQPKKI